MITLDVELLRTFVHVADTRSFTAAGSALGATQSAVSVRLKKLEDRIGRRLLERTPRSVTLTAPGEAFLQDARDVLATHDNAIQRLLGQNGRIELSLGISDHAAGAYLPSVLAKVCSAIPDLQLSVTVGLSEHLMEDFNQGAFDAVILRRDSTKRNGTPLFRDRLAWVSAPRCSWRRGQPLPLLSLAAPCSVRARSIHALDDAGIAWREVFVGTGVAAVQAAVTAGLGVACLGLRNKPSGAIALGHAEGLPSLADSDIVMFERKTEPRLRGIVAKLAEAFMSAGATESNAG